MKLAEALQERADLNRQIEQLKQRISNNAIVQEGEHPSENPDELIAELDGCIKRLEELISRINLTNCTTLVDGKSLTELIARKDCLSLKLYAYKEFVFNASQTASRARRTEIKILSAIDVKEYQKKIDMMAKELRVTDNKIQAANWSAELK